ncbi:MAG: hypothetical protein PVI43_01780 [Candidatus Bathyarchaeota archaeon]
MKKTGIVIFSMLLLLVLVFAVNVSAYNAEYTHILYQSEAVPVIDGTYIVDADWIASGREDFGDGAAFHDQWVMDPNLYCLIVEVTDNTDDAGDKLTICFDGTASGGTTEPDGGANPTQYDKKLEVTGHGGSATIQWFVGDGSGWVVSGVSSAGFLELAQALTSTPTIEAEHYVYEMNIMKLDESFGSPLMGYTWAEFVSYYDEDTGETQQWPPADATPAGSPDVPDSWGFITYAQEPNPETTIPEGTGFVVMLTVSSVAVAGALVLRKRKK